MTWKLSMPPAALAPRFRDMFQNAPPANTYPWEAARGFDWQLNTEAFTRLTRMANQEWNIPAIQVAIIGPHQGRLWKQALGFFDPDMVPLMIWLHPFQTIDSANYTLWHEIQHAYQELEDRMDQKGYRAFDEDDPSQYREHPIEIDANAFADIMQGESLIDHAPPKIEPSWVPNELHLDRGEWNDATELWELTPGQLAEELVAQVRLFRTEYQFWQSTWQAANGDDYSMFAKTAMPYANNVFYHVTNSHWLQSIVENGLKPKGSGSTNWPGMAVSDEAVYMWPNISMARAYFSQLTFPQGQAGKHIILRLTNLDLQKMAPDHEDLASWVYDRMENAKNWPGVDADEAANLFKEVSEQSEWAQYVEHMFDKEGGYDVTPEDALKIVSELTPDLRTRLAEEMGTALMYFGVIPPQNIEIAFLYTYEQLSEQFDQEKMDNDPEWMMTDENEDQYYEELDQYMADVAQSANIAEYISSEGIQRMIEEAVDDSHEDKFAPDFGYKPINQWQQIGVPDYGPEPTRAF